MRRTGEILKEPKNLNSYILLCVSVIVLLVIFISVALVGPEVITINEASGELTSEGRLLPFLTDIFLNSNYGVLNVVFTAFLAALCIKFVISSQNKKEKYDLLIGLIHCQLIFLLFSCFSDFFWNRNIYHLSWEGKASIVFHHCKNIILRASIGVSFSGILVSLLSVRFQRKVEVNILSAVSIAMIFSNLILVSFCCFYVQLPLN